MPMPMSYQPMAMPMNMGYQQTAKRVVKKKQAVPSALQNHRALLRDASSAGIPVVDQHGKFVSTAELKKQLEAHNQEMESFRASMSKKKAKADIPDQPAASNVAPVVDAKPDV